MRKAEARELAGGEKTLVGMNEDVVCCHRQAGMETYSPENRHHVIVYIGRTLPIYQSCKPALSPSSPSSSPIAAKLQNTRFA
ncbi:unnamed protein product [Protopolystoma xenopodis]|uniref:Uncharacterized protein n=1 Tax=Protopolystoma xenopodis TaxID=117903 RepID=A0A3S5CHC9_9PLAT|nr:unnamed protein product [Protopolystoma xenopodis]